MKFYIKIGQSRKNWIGLIHQTIQYEKNFYTIKERQLSPSKQHIQTHPRNEKQIVQIVQASNLWAWTATRPELAKRIIGENFQYYPF